MAAKNFVLLILYALLRGVLKDYGKGGRRLFLGKPPASKRRRFRVLLTRKALRPNAPPRH
jgi:hypothetical protein